MYILNRIIMIFLIIPMYQCICTKLHTSNNNNNNNNNNKKRDWRKSGNLWTHLKENPLQGFPSPKKKFTNKIEVVHLES